MLATVVGAGRCLLEFKTRGSKLASTIYIYIYICVCVCVYICVCVILNRHGNGCPAKCINMV